MRDSLTSRNAGDFNQRYNRSIGWLLDEKTKERKVLVVIRAVDHAKVTFTDLHGINYYANADQNIEFEFIPIDRGYFMGTDDALYYLQRVPARQWTRGISFQNTGVSRYASGRWRAEDATLQILHPILTNKNNYGFVEGRKVNALSKHFAIADNSVLFLQQNIGTYNLDGGKHSVVLNGKLVFQEFLDVIRRKGYPISVSFKE